MDTPGPLVETDPVSQLFRSPADAGRDNESVPQEGS
jgi:hypothetical protein